MSKFHQELVLVSPETLTVTHITDGEEVITGDDDGQAWVAVFPSAEVAELFVAHCKASGRAIYGQRGVDLDDDTQPHVVTGKAQSPTAQPESTASNFPCVICNGLHRGVCP